MAITLWKAVTDQDFDQANSLVDQEYRKVGYRLPHDPLLPDIRTAFPEATVFLAKNAALSLSGTIALIGDTMQGLPIDTAFHEELAPLRQANVRLAEIGRLAIAKNDADDTRQILPSLYTVVLAAALKQAFDALVITVNPKHDPLYRQFGFEPLGTEKAYPLLQNAPAIARILFLKDIDPKYFRFLPQDPTALSFSSDFEFGTDSLSFS